MGYRSYINIKIEFRKEVSEERIKEICKRFNDKIELSRVEYAKDSNALILFYDYIKWYTGFIPEVDDVVKIMKEYGNKSLEDDNFDIQSVQFARIGESDDDAETEYYGEPDDWLEIERSIYKGRGRFEELKLDLDKEEK